MDGCSAVTRAGSPTELARVQEPPARASRGISRRACAQSCLVFVRDGRRTCAYDASHSDRSLLLLGEAPESRPRVCGLNDQAMFLAISAAAPQWMCREWLQSLSWRAPPRSRHLAPRAAGDVPRACPRSERLSLAIRGLLTLESIGIHPRTTAEPPGAPANLWSAVRGATTEAKKTAPHLASKGGPGFVLHCVHA